MGIAYVSPAKMAEYRQTIQLFAKGAPALECIRSHYMPSRNGLCDLTDAKEQEELFVLANRAGQTMKISANAMQIVANIIDINGADEWYQRLKDQRKAHRERLALETQKKEEEKRAASRSVLVRKKSPNTIVKSSS